MEKEKGKEARKRGKVKGLYQRGNVWWMVYQDLFGKMHFESTKTPSKREAEYLLACRRKEIKEGKIPEVKKIRNYSFNQLAEEYLQWARTQRAYRDKSNRVKQLAGIFGNYPLRGFTSRLVEQYQIERLQRNKPATVNRILAVLKHMFTKAVEWDMVEEDVLKRVRKVKLIQENNRRLRFLSKEECQALVEACSPHLRPIVITGLNSGMRKGEILGLKWEQVDLRHDFILLGITKNGERREIPINSTLRATLEAIPHGLESEYVFVDRNGNPFKEVRRSFDTALKRAGIQDFRFHDLRHTFASHLVMAGVDITTVKELLGHKNLTMTLRYSHLAPFHKANAVRVLEERIGAVCEDSSDLLDNYLTVEQGCLLESSPKCLFDKRAGEDSNPRPSD